MEDDEDLVPISGLQHLVFCERQAALIHVERIWRDDLATTKGQLVHARADTPGVSTRAGVRVLRALPLVSRRLGVVGVADFVELDRVDGQLRPVPLEVKKGRLKRRRADDVQLCAQGMCLEEAFGVPVTEGFIFYAESHRRRRVPLDAALREITARAAARLRELVARREVPAPAVPERVCAVCSLVSICLPRATRDARRASRFLERLAEGGE